MATLDEGVVRSVSYTSQQDFTVHDWLKKFECKTLTDKDFRHYWASHVPPIYSPKEGCDCLNMVFEENAAKTVLFSPLEKFVCGNDNPDAIFKDLKMLDNPPSLCGKVFKMGEPTYSCRDCGLDPTCVLCVDCFKNSDHKLHRYKMSISSGGGYCDCGDTEAWKAHPSCEVHTNGGNQQLSEGTSAISRLPPDVAERARLVMQTVLHYANQMLTWEQAFQLPPELHSPAERLDIYAAVLYNDEIHTYEQVITTLTRAIKLKHKQAIDFATTIDREGRSIVTCAKLDACSQVQSVVERTTSRHSSKPLKTVVMHASVLGHQFFAMRLLAWLQRLLAHCEGFRHILSQTMTEPSGTDPPLLETIMLTDSQLWKAARNQWHQLFITGLLMDQESKQTFARLFTRNYPELMKEFIADDHEHSASVTSLSVQIFTVPTLAHALIKDNALATLFRTFLTECERNCNQDGKLAFERNQANPSFRRAQYVLYDIKYLLTVRPREWNTEMRKSFYYGIQFLLKLLSWMQGMDSIVRQVGQHVEFEAEWETGINLQLKLSSIATLAIEWAGSDRIILVKVLKSALKLLDEMQRNMTLVIREVAGHPVACIDYDVASMPVTVHLQLSRLVAGLLLHLGRYGLVYGAPDFPMPADRLMELPLRTLVMVAQFRVGMWRRNGYSLLNQVYFYHNARLREEMYDRDIQMLQIAGSLIESNSFLIHLLNKFALLAWARDGTEAVRKPEDESLRHTVTLGEEFLGLVLTLVSERHTPGIGAADEREAIKKEIVQLLCIEPMPHSQLFKMLPKDCNHETGMEEVIDQVAEFKKPQGAATGKYELRPDHYQEFNPFFYHYTREEQSKAHEVQLKRRKQAGEEACCPPPVPPRFAPGFESITGLLRCDVMLHVLVQVLQRTVDLLSQLFSETQFEKVLHLIGLALHEERRSIEEETQRYCFTEAAVNKGLLSLLEDCLKCPRIDTQKCLLKWTVKRFRTVEGQSKMGRHECPQEQAESTGEVSKEERTRNAELAAARRARIMAQMSAMQKNFIREHADLFQEAVEAENNMVVEMAETRQPACSDLVAIGVPWEQGRYLATESHICILCRESHEVTASGSRMLVLSAFVQRSTVLSKNRVHQLDDGDSYDPCLPSADLFSGPHVSTCGHVMHSDCWQKFFDTVLMKERQRPQRYGRHYSFDIDKNEFLCPLCERLSNTVIPLLPPVRDDARSFERVEIQLDDWLSSMRKAIEKVHVFKVPNPGADADSSDHFLHRYNPSPLTEVLTGLVPGVSKMVEALFNSYQIFWNITPFPDPVKEMMRLFSQSAYTVGLNVNPSADDDRVPLMAWWACIYTIRSTECVLSDQDKPLFGSLSSRQDHCLSALCRFVAVSVRGVFEVQVVRSHCVRMLRYLLLGECYLSNPQCILETDAFGLLVNLALSVPTLYAETKTLPYPLGNAMDESLLRTMYVFHLVQLLLTHDLSDDGEEETPMDVDGASTSDVDEAAIGQFYRELVTAAGVHNQASPSGQRLVQCVRTGSLPFLRCAGLFYHYITNVAPPTALQDQGEQFELLCRYLSIPDHFSELLQSSSLRQLALSWARHARVHYLVNEDLRKSGVADPEVSALPQVVRHPLSVNQLVSLPGDYSELINNVSVFCCPNSEGDDCRTPTMCLVCGKILCSQNYCCQTEVEGMMVGACVSHANSCGAGTGVFLRVRDCKILLLTGRTKGCYMHPPYVDDYGETDQGLIRGNPLHLCSERYREIHRLWLNHNIPEQIAHALELSTSLSATNWQLM